MAEKNVVQLIADQKYKEATNALLLDYVRTNSCLFKRDDLEQWGMVLAM